MLAYGEVILFTHTFYLLTKPSKQRQCNPFIGSSSRILAENFNCPPGQAILVTYLLVRDVDSSDIRPLTLQVGKLYGIVNHLYVCNTFIIYMYYLCTVVSEFLFYCMLW